MVEYILGNFLVERGKITDDQLKAALEQMNSVRVKLGLIAVAEGMMTTEQAETVNRLQTTCDKRFGDIAVEQGYLTDEQVGKLLKRQGNTYFMFAQTLVDLALVEMEEVDGILEAFRKSKDYTISEMEDLKSDDVDRIIPIFVPEEAKEFEEIIGVAVRTVIRLIDRRVSIGKAEVLSNVKVGSTVSQKLDGDGGLNVSLSEKSGGLLKVCSVFGQEEFNTLDLDSLDAAGEFLNCMNGLYVSGMSRDGSFLELMPPEYSVDGLEENGCVCRVPVSIQDKELYLVVAKLA